MQTRTAYPHDALTGGCFVSGDYSTDEPIVDLDIYVDALPPFGRLCVSAKGVRMMVAALGWELMTPAFADALRLTSEEADRLEHENSALRGALGRVIDAAQLAELVQVAELATDFPALEPVP
jgi:hypothetical protein